MNKERLESLSDGIIVVAATIMVLQLDPPSEVTFHSIAGQWPTLLAYIISFFQIYLSWYSHHTSFRHAENLNMKIFLVNGVWLFLISMVSTVTGMVGRNPNSTHAELLYILLLFLWTLAFQVLDTLIVRANPGLRRDVIRTPTARGMFFGGYALAAALAFFVPVFSLVVVAGISVAWAILLLFLERKSNKKGTSIPLQR